MKLICVDVEATLPAIAPPVEGEQWVLVRLHGEPLGMVYAPDEGYTPPALAREILARHGWSIVRHLVADNLSNPLPIDDLASIAATCPRSVPTPQLGVTVAVCTRNHAAQLPECLAALDALDYPAALLDVVIVDNAPADRSTQRVVEQYPRMRYVCEPRPGLDNARNRAVTESRGEIVAYTDDDVRVDRGWVTAIAAAFQEEPQAMCVTGLVVPDETDTRPQLLFERYGGFGRGFSRCLYRVDVDRGESAVAQYGGTGRFGTGANMAFRRSFFARHGSFDPALDVGTPANGGGDLEMFLRVLQHGHSLVYEPAAMVRHRHRRTYAELRTQIANNGVGFYAYLVRTARVHPHECAAVIRLGASWLWWWSVRRLLAALLRPRTFPIDLILAELKGSFVGLTRYRPRAEAG